MTRTALLLLLLGGYAQAAPGVRAGVSLAGRVGLGGTTGTYGPGLVGDLGVVLDDAWSVVGRVGVSGVVIFNLSNAGLGLERAIDEKWSVAGGVSFGLFASLASDLPASTALLVPLRLDYALGQHGALSERRRGWLAWFEVMPGFTLAQSCGFTRGPCPPAPWFAIVGSVGIGYAWR